MNAPDWLSRNVSRLLPYAKAAATTPAKTGIENKNDKNVAAKSPVVSVNSTDVAIKSKATSPIRTTRERLQGSLRRQQEALSPRVLRRTLQELQAIVDPHVSEVEGGRRAKGVAQWYAQATPEQRRDCWLLMSEQFMADPLVAKTAQAQYVAAVGTPEEAVAEVRLRKSTVSPRRRLLQRFSVLPEGIRFLVNMRAEMLPFLKSDKRLLALDVEMEYMFSTWFDVGFLELRRISWDSPASLIEKLIKYEAVHDIKGWTDVKNRLDSDRRCYGFFHPRLPDEPLIFVEVALLNEIAGCITPLLDEDGAAVDVKKASTAIFYSISNTQVGLKGVSFGDSLIKRVVETLKDEFPKLKTFATLSPIPGFRNWLSKHIDDVWGTLSDKERVELGHAVGLESPTAQQVLGAADRMSVSGADQPKAVRALLLKSAALYLGKAWQDNKPFDAVARFHLGNGARVERINWAGDLSTKGVKQSYGLMVNYLYDLKRLERHRQGLLLGKIAVSSAVESLY